MQEQRHAQSMLQAGATLNVYEIVGFLAAGGMGEVYRARDTRLQRDVAVKILPFAFATDPTRLARFEREARSAAALHHPNICTIYDVGQTPQGQPYLVMELLEGETLHDRLTRGPLPVADVIDLGIVLADALDTAHAKTLIHRDLKPANVFLTAHGPKLLDFGLAKSVTAQHPIGPSTQPTMTGSGPVTEIGSAVGTVAYMSPEQLRAEPLDPRTDLFSLGVVLYEAATGRPAFGGTTGAVVAAAILHETPSSARHLRPDLPAALDSVILKTLEKQRDLRTQSAAELRADLKRVKRDLESRPVAHPPSEPAHVSATGGASVPAARTHRVSTAVALAIVVLAGVAAWYVAVGRRASSTSSDLSSTFASVTRLTDTGTATRAAISPDGRYIAYIQHEGAEDSVWLRQTATDSVTRILAPEPGVGLWTLSFTPDGNFIDLIRGNTGRQLVRLPVLGGPPKRLAVDVQSPVAWSPDGKQLTWISIMPETGETRVVVADPDAEHTRTLAVRKPPAGFTSLFITSRPAVAPAWSLDGETLAVSAFGDSDSEIALIRVTDGTQRPLRLGPSVVVRGLAWLDRESLAIVHGTEAAAPQLWRMRVADGAMSKLTNDVNAYDGVSVTSDQTALVTSQIDTRVTIWIGDATGRRGSEPLPSSSWPQYATFFATVGWLGENVLFQRVGAGRFTVASVHDAEMVDLLANATSASGTADGRTIVFADQNTSGVWRSDSDGRNRRQLTPDGSPVAVTRDGAVVFVSRVQGNQSPWIVSLNGGPARQLSPLFAAAANIDVSRDGQRLLFITRERDRRYWVVCAMPSCTEPIKLEPPNLLSRSVWTPDGRGIAYVNAADDHNIWIQPIDGGAPVQLTNFTDGQSIADFAWSHDGTRLAISRVRSRSDIVLFKRGNP